MDLPPECAVILDAIEEHFPADGWRLLRYRWIPSDDDSVFEVRAVFLDNNRFEAEVRCGRELMDMVQEYKRRKNAETTTEGGSIDTGESAGGRS